MSHWATQYVGRPYIPREFDCMDLVVLVQKEQFGKTIVLPNHSVSPTGRKNQIEEGKHLVSRLETAEDGCLVLLKVRGYVQHAGLMCRIGNEWYVLHNTRANKMGVLLQRERDMGIRGYTVEGYYKWV